METLLNPDLAALREPGEVARGCPCRVLLWAPPFLLQFSVLVYLELLLPLQLPGQTEGIALEIFGSGGKKWGPWVEKWDVKPGTFVVPALSVVPASSSVCLCPWNCPRIVAHISWDISF